MSDFFNSSECVVHSRRLLTRFWANHERTFIQDHFAVDVESGVPDEAVEMNGYAYSAAHPRVVTKSDVHRT